MIVHTMLTTVLLLTVHICSAQVTSIQQIIFPDSDNSDSTRVSNNRSSSLESSLSTSVQRDQLDRNYANFYQQFQGSSRSSCSLPVGGIGQCRRLSQCSYFVPLVQKIHEPRVFQYIKQHICSIQPGFRVSLCCPSRQQQQPIPLLPDTPPIRPPSNAFFGNAASSSVSPVVNGGFNNNLGFSGPSTTGNSQSQSFSTGSVSSNSDCGISNEIRVVGGQKIRPGTFPWLAAVGFPLSGRRFQVECGGSLVTRRHVISAAHCPPSLSHVRLGEHDVTTSGDGALHQDFRVAGRADAGYNNNTKRNDISVLTLDRQVFYTDFIRPICLPTRFLTQDNYQSASFRIIGWGTEQEGGRGSNVPNSAIVPNVNIQQCRQQYSSRINIDTNSQLCAAGQGIDTCQGDSGGPLQYQDKDKGIYYLAGVVSFGQGCAQQSFPGVYTRIDAFLPFIEAIIKS